TLTPAFIDSTHLQVTGPMPKPINSGGAMPVQVINPDGGTFTKNAAFIFPASTVSFGAKGFVPSSLSSTGLAVADIDGDGLADIVHAGASGLVPFGGATGSTTGGLLFHKNLGGNPVTFSTVSLDSGNYYDVKLVDANPDGTIVNTYGVNSIACVGTDGNGQVEIAAGVGMNPSSGPMLNYAATTAGGFFGTWTQLGGIVGPPYYGSTTGMTSGDFLGTGQPN